MHLSVRGYTRPKSGAARTARSGILSNRLAGRRLSERNTRDSKPLDVTESTMAATVMEKKDRGAPPVLLGIKEDR
jgi:hypothetical protein